MIPIVFETSGSDANFESGDEERLMAIMDKEPTQSFPSLQLTGPEVFSSNQSVTWHEETSNMVSPLCYTHKKKKKGKMPDQEAKSMALDDDSDQSPQSIDNKYGVTIMRIP